MSVASCGCDAAFAGLAACHWQVPPQLRRPTGLRRPQAAGTALPAPSRVGMELIGNKGWG